MGSSLSMDVPDQTGKTVLITGANTGIGYHTAAIMGRAGAHVIVCARDEKKGIDAIEKLKIEAPKGTYEVGIVDLSSLASVKAFAKSIVDADRAIDILINNAGIMAVPKRELSKDGFEMQLATNCLGHYALTLLLLKSLQKRPGTRVVNVSSLVAKNGKRPNGETIEFVRNPPFNYEPMGVYSESKLLNLLFNNELARRCPELTCVGAHPGVSDTGLFKHKWGWATWAFQKPEVGALASVKAAVDPSVKSQDYCGAPGPKGPPEIIKMPRLAYDEPLAAEYWAAMETATGVVISKL